MQIQGCVLLNTSFVVLVLNVFLLCGLLCFHYRVLLQQSVIFSVQYILKISTKYMKNYYQNDIEQKEDVEERGQEFWGS